MNDEQKQSIHKITMQWRRKVLKYNQRTRNYYQNVIASLNSNNNVHEKSSRSTRTRNKKSTHANNINNDSNGSFDIESSSSTFAVAANKNNNDDDNNPNRSEDLIRIHLQYTINKLSILKERNIQQEKYARDCIATLLIDEANPSSMEVQKRIAKQCQNEYYYQAYELLDTYCRFLLEHSAVLAQVLSDPSKKREEGESYPKFTLRSLLCTSGKNDEIIETPVTREKRKTMKKQSGPLHIKDEDVTASEDSLTEEHDNQRSIQEVPQQSQPQTSSNVADVVGGSLSMSPISSSEAVTLLPILSTVLWIATKWELIRHYFPELIQFCAEIRRTPYGRQIVDDATANRNEIVNESIQFFLERIQLYQQWLLEHDPTSYEVLSGNKTSRRPSKSKTQKQATTTSITKLKIHRLFPTVRTKKKTTKRRASGKIEPQKSFEATDGKIDPHTILHEELFMYEEQLRYLYCVQHQPPKPVLHRFEDSIQNVLDLEIQCVPKSTKLDRDSYMTISSLSVLPSLDVSSDDLFWVPPQKKAFANDVEYKESDDDGGMDRMNKLGIENDPPQISALAVEITPLSSSRQDPVTVAPVCTTTDPIKNGIEIEEDPWAMYYPSTNLMDNNQPVNKARLTTRTTKIKGILKKTTRIPLCEPDLRFM